MPELRRRSLTQASEGGGVPDFSTASWSEIQNYINNHGTDDFDDQVGKTRTITLSDNHTYILRLANATGNLYELADGSGYTGFIVEFFTGGRSSKWNTTGTTEGGWASSFVRNDTMQLIKYMLPRDLLSIIQTVKVVGVNSATGSYLQTSNDKLFLPSTKEIGLTAGRPLEVNALTTWKYYQLHNTNRDRVKQRYDNRNCYWWTRTPSNGSLSQVCYIRDTGESQEASATFTSPYAIPCFCLAPNPVIAPDFRTASWASIQAHLDEYGADAFDCQLGYERSITLSDNSVHTLRLANILGNNYELADGSGYTGLVIEFTDIVTKSVFSSNGKSTGKLDEINPIGTTTLPAIKAMLPNDLRSILANVKVERQGSTDGTIVSSNMDIFIPTNKELTISTNYSPQTEFNYFTTWMYYWLNNGNASRIRNYNGSASSWVTRSMYFSGDTSIAAVTNSGGFSSSSTSLSNGISPCFCLAQRERYLPITSLDVNETNLDAFIDTGIVINNEFTYSRIIIDADIEAVSGSTPVNPFGVTNNNNNFRFGQFTNAVYLYFNVGGVSVYTDPLDTSLLGTMLTVNLTLQSAGGFRVTPSISGTINGQNVSATTTSGSFTNMNNIGSNLYIFRRNLNNSGTYGVGKMKLRSFKLYKGSDNTLLLDLVPMLRERDAKAGMLNLVSGMFFASSGTDDFSYTP